MATAFEGTDRFLAEADCVAVGSGCAVRVLFGVTFRRAASVGNGRYGVGVRVSDDKARGLDRDVGVAF